MWLSSRGIGFDKLSLTMHRELAEHICTSLPFASAFIGRLLSLCGFPLQVSRVLKVLTLDLPVSDRNSVCTDTARLHQPARAGPGGLDLSERCMASPTGDGTHENADSSAVRSMLPEWIA